MKNTSPLIHNQKIVETIIPKMRYDGQEPLSVWQKKAEEKLRALLGMDKFTLCDDKLEIEYDVERKSYREVRFVFQSEEGYFIPCHLLLPKKRKAPYDVAIVLQGHSKGMHISLGRAKFPGEEESVADGCRSFALQAIENGIAALTVEQRNFGECGGTEKGPQCYVSSMAALLIGRTTLGERVWDISRAIDVLARHFSDVVTLEKLICLGTSGGGTAAYYAACLEKRIRITVPSCSVCSFDDSIIAMEHCSCNFVPNMRTYFDMGDMSGMIAPRKLVVVAGNQDPIFPLKGVVKSFDIIKKMYSEANASDACKLVIGEGKHRFYPEDAWPEVMDFIK